MNLVRDSLQELEGSFRTAAQEGGKREFHRLRFGESAQTGIRLSAGSTCVTQFRHVVENIAQRFPGALKRADFREVSIKLNVQEGTEPERRLTRLQ